MSFVTPTRAQIVEWASVHAPDLQVQHREGASRARFSVNGRTFELVSEGPEAREQVYVGVWETIREAHNMPVRHRAEADEETMSLTQQIIAARMNNDGRTADQIAMQLARKCGDSARLRMRRGQSAEMMPGSELRQQFHGADRRRVF